jgi:hypothetical protein
MKLSNMPGNHPSPVYLSPPIQPLQGLTSHVWQAAALKAIFFSYLFLPNYGGSKPPSRIDYWLRMRLKNSARGKRLQLPNHDAAAGYFAQFILRSWKLEKTPSAFADIKPDSVPSHWIYHL